MSVLHYLEPQSNLNELRIESYGGLAFPGWLGNALYLCKMVDLSLVNCRECTSLPCLGQLPSLKRLWIEGMVGVKKVGAEFYFYGEAGVSTSTEKIFPSLEFLYFGNMSEWEDWSSSSAKKKSVFPSLHELNIRQCPKLIKELPACLPLLTTLSVSHCPKLESTLLRNYPSLEELDVNECDERIFQSGIELTSLTRLRVNSISALINLQQRGFVRSLPGLQVLNIQNCKKLTYLWEDMFEFESEGLVSSLGLGCHLLRSLEIFSCDKFERLPNGWQKSLTCLEELEIRYCPMLVSFPEVGFPPNLRHLKLEKCKGFKCLPDGMTSYLCLLESLEILKCSSLIFFPKGQLPTTLRTLSIRYCKNLESLPEGMMHSSSIPTGMCCAALEVLIIEGCPSLADFPRGSLPTTLKEIKIRRCENLKYLPDGIMHQQPSSNTTTNGAFLQCLHLSHCPSLASFPRGKFPSTLKELKINSCEQLESISEEMFHSSTNNYSLQSLSIKEYPNLKALPDCLYDLSGIYITTCKNLELRAHQFQNFTRLTSLEVDDCENINTPLSQWGLTRLPSLTSLSISGLFPDATSFSFSDDHHSPLLPSTLTSLSIEQFQNLESLASLSLQTLTSLQNLSIVDCRKLRFILPREGLLPDSLSQLRSWRCPLLRQRFSKEDGEDWPKIAHIPCVEIFD